MLNSEQFSDKIQSVKETAGSAAVGILDKGRQRLSRELACLSDQELLNKAIDLGVPKEGLPELNGEPLSEKARDQVVF